MTDERVEISVSEKAVLTISECASYSNIGINKLQKLCNSEEGKSFTFRNGKRFMIKRKAFDKWLEKVEQI